MAPEASIPSRPASAGLKLLMLDDVIPAQRLGFGYPRSLEILKGLAGLGCEVTFFPTFDQERREPETSELAALGIRFTPARVESDADFYAFFAETCRDFDAVWISRTPNIKRYMDGIKQIAPALPVIFDAECLTTYRDMQRLTVLGETDKIEDMRLAADDEAKLIDRADLVVTVSEKERDILIRHGVRRAVVLGHKVDAESTLAGFGDRRDLLFVGRFAAELVPPPFSPNHDAVSHFCSHILPSIAERTGATLRIVGTGSEDLALPPAPEVRILGAQRFLQAHYQAARIFVAPTRFSAGIPLKVLDAMAAGLPCVITRHLADQLGGAIKDAALVADSDREFSDAVCEIYENEELWLKIRNSGLLFSQALGSHKKFDDQIRTVISTFLLIFPLEDRK
jgi:O-antigen biosynthesis protein